MRLHMHVVSPDRAILDGGGLPCDSPWLAPGARVGLGFTSGGVGLPGPPARVMTEVMIFWIASDPRPNSVNTSGPATRQAGRLGVSENKGRSSGSDLGTMYLVSIAQDHLTHTHTVAVMFSACPCLFSSSPLLSRPPLFPDPPRLASSAGASKLRSSPSLLFFPAAEAAQRGSSCLRNRHQRYELELELELEKPRDESTGSPS